MNNTIASLVIALRSASELCLGMPFGDKPAADILEVVGDEVRQALGLKEVPAKLAPAFATLDRLARLRRDPEAKVHVTFEHVRLTCENITRALEARSAELKAAAKAEAERIAGSKLRKEGVRAVRKAVLTKLSELGVAHDAYASDTVLQAALVAAGGKVPTPEQALRALNPEAVAKVPAAKPVVATPAAVEVKPREPYISPERGALLQEVTHYGVQLPKPIGECSNSDLYFFLRGAKGKHAARVEGVRSRWERANRAYQGMGKETQPFPISAESSVSEVEAAEKRLGIREAFVQSQQSGNQRLERSRRGFYPKGPPTAESPWGPTPDEPVTVEKVPEPTTMVAQPAISSAPPAPERAEIQAQAA